MSPACGQMGAIGSPRVALQDVFRAELGMSDRKTIGKYLHHTGLPYGHEWCAAFVSWCFGQIGHTEPRTPWSPSLFPRRRIVWEQGALRTPTGIQPGTVWGIYIRTKNRIGHVGFVDEERNGIIITVEGNTRPPEGTGNNGVYRKRRPWRTLKAIAEWL